MQNYDDDVLLIEPMRRLTPISRTRNFITCTCARHKRAYNTRKEARLARRGHYDSHLEVYRCPVSGLWHLGHRTAAS